MQQGGYIIQSQHLSVNDGDGIRTILFLAGCPLRCQWCANPEGFTSQAKVGFFAEHCTACRLCTQVCPQGIDINLNLERDRCTACGACTQVCPHHAKKYLTEYKTVDELVEEVKRQMIFFRHSGGGVTFSGGEATMQTEFLRALANRLSDMGVHLAMETSAYFDYDKVRDILLLLDQLFVDIKHMDDAKHQQYTGVSNKRILENISRMKELKIPIVVRIPTIIGVNADEENIRATACFVRDNLPGAQIELLPYHTLGLYKYEALGLPLPPERFVAPTAEELTQLRALVESCGVVTTETK